MTIYRLLAYSVFCLAAIISTATDAGDLPLPAQPHLVVQGLGEVEQVPDLITLHLDVSATAENFSAAKQQVDSIIGKAIKAAKKYGVGNDDINASKINAAPQYEWDNQQRIYKGEMVSRQLEVTLKKPDSYNDLVEALLGAGITRLQNVELGFSHKVELEAAALKLALDNAQQQAKTIAQHLHTQLVMLYQVAPLSAESIERPMAMAAIEMSARSEQAPLTLAKQKVQQRVQIIYLLPE